MTRKFCPWLHGVFDPESPDLGNYMRVNLDEVFLHNHIEQMGLYSNTATIEQWETKETRKMAGKGTLLDSQPTNPALRLISERAKLVFDELNLGNVVQLLPVLIRPPQADEASRYYYVHVLSSCDVLDPKLTPSEYNKVHKVRVFDPNPETLCLRNSLVQDAPAIFRPKLLEEMVLVDWDTAVALENRGLRGFDFVELQMSN